MEVPFHNYDMVCSPPVGPERTQLTETVDTPAYHGLEGIPQLSVYDVCHQVS